MIDCCCRVCFRCGCQTAKRVALQRSGAIGAGAARAMSTDKQITVPFTKDIDTHNREWQCPPPTPRRPSCVPSTPCVLLSALAFYITQHSYSYTRYMIRCSYCLSKYCSIPRYMHVDNQGLELLYVYDDLAVVCRVSCIFYLHLVRT